MTLPLVIVLAAAFGGALLVWHIAGRTKHCSEGMLKTYAEMLAEARVARADQQPPESEEEEAEGHEVA